MFKAVIGANFGDEGKGRTVDYLASKMENPVVVRHNSGAQAGHTVIRDGKRHVFHQLGSASLQDNASTLLCHKFVLDPIKFNEEYDQVTELRGSEPTVYLGPDVLFSTPLDVLLNQMQEMSRSNRHGSCGMGFGEAIFRREQHPKLFWHHIDELQTYFLDQVASRGLRVPEHTIQYQIYRQIVDEAFDWNIYQTAVFKMLRRVKLVNDLKMFFDTEDEIIFEGAQGLCLHQDHEYFPHVTRSRTGIEDILEVLAETDQLDPLEVYYCTRPYITRHGAGPLPGEVSAKPFPHIEDETNIDNEYQGTLRFAHMNNDFVRKHIKEDLARSSGRTEVIPRIVINCCDQVRSSSVDVFAMASALSTGISTKPTLFGFGPQAEQTVQERQLV